MTRHGARSRAKATLPERRLNEQRRRHIKPDARQLFPLLLERLLASRPVITHAELDRSAWGGPVLGKPTFRNYIDENGKHV